MWKKYVYLTLEKQTKQLPNLFSWCFWSPKAKTICMVTDFYAFSNHRPSVLNFMNMNVSTKNTISDIEHFSQINIAENLKLKQ